MQLIVHGHFYQPPRENPFTGRVPREASAAPYHDWNQRITAECYGPNVALGNFARLSFDLGPTLARWLQRYARAIHRGIVRQGRKTAMAQAYNHTILPLAPLRDKRTQVYWGIVDFQRRFGRAPRGMWLPETAADLETLDVLAAAGIEYTILAPWQATQSGIDTTRAYRVQTSEQRWITVLFFDAWLSGSVSFDPWATEDAKRFVQIKLAERRDGQRAEERLLLIASDGELYGHHQRGREHWLRLLLEHEAPLHGYHPATPADYLRLFPARDTVEVRDRTSWSCLHGVARWSTGCPCTEGDSSWKSALRAALDRLGRALDAACEQRAEGRLKDFWRARDASIGLLLGDAPAAFLAEHAARPLTTEDEAAMLKLLAAQYYGQAMQVSDAYYWEDVSRLEPRTALAYAVQAVALAREAGAGDLEPRLRHDLALVRSARTGLTAADYYDEARHQREQVLAGTQG